MIRRERTEKKKLTCLFPVFRWYWLHQQKQMWSVRIIIDCTWTKKEESEIMFWTWNTGGPWQWRWLKYGREEGHGLNAWHVKFQIMHKNLCGIGLVLNGRWDTCGHDDQHMISPEPEVSIPTWETTFWQMFPANRGEWASEMSVTGTWNYQGKQSQSTKMEKQHFLH